MLGLNFTRTLNSKAFLDKNFKLHPPDQISGYANNELLTKANGATVVTELIVIH
jgi:hypothetical protein